MHRNLALATAAAVSALALSACGDDSSSSSSSATPSPTASPATASGGGGSNLTLTSSEPGPERFAFSKKSLQAKAGEVTIDLSLPGDNQAPHAIAIEGDGVEESGQIGQPGGNSSVTADLKPGTYTFYCPVGDHREEGMEGKLVVR